MTDVKTGSIIKVGTYSKISMTLDDFSDRFVWVPDLRLWGLMRPQYDVDMFRVHSPCINAPVCRLTLTSNEFGAHAGWYCDHVEVTATGPNTACSKSMFYVQQWLSNDVAPYQMTAIRNACNPWNVNTSTEQVIYLHPPILSLQTPLRALPSKFIFSTDPLHHTWHHVDAPLIWRTDMIIALVGHSIVFTGGTCDYENGHNPSQKSQTDRIHPTNRETEENFVKYQTARWLLYSGLLVPVWGIGIFMLLYLSTCCYILRKDIRSRKLYLTPNAIVYKLSMQSRFHFQFSGC
ncbi:hypothetical protein PS1_038677 [Malus domestica]